MIILRALKDLGVGGCGVGLAVATNQFTESIKDFGSVCAVYAGLLLTTLLCYKVVLEIRRLKSKPKNKEDDNV